MSISYGRLQGSGYNACTGNKVIKYYAQWAQKTVSHKKKEKKEKVVDNTVDGMKIEGKYLMKKEQAIIDK